MWTKKMAEDKIQSLQWVGWQNTQVSMSVSTVKCRNQLKVIYMLADRLLPHDSRS